MLLSRIARHEWRVLVAERTVLVLSLVLGAALALGLVNGLRWRAAQARAQADAVTEERDRVAAALQTIESARAKKTALPSFSDPANPDTAARQFAAHYAVLPSYPLLPLAVGQTDLLPSHVKVTSESREALLAGGDTSNPLGLLTGHIDVAFVLVYLYPLFLLGMTFNMLTGEREQGTLALVLSQPVTPRQLLEGKMLLRVRMVSAVALVMLVVAGAVAGRSVGEAGVAVRVAGVAAVVLIYGLFWIALALAAGLRGRSSANTAVVLAGCWLLLTVIVPSAGHLLIEAAYPVPSRVELIQAMRTASDAANREGASLLGRYYQDHPDMAVEGTSTTDFAVVKLAVDARIEESVAPVVERFDTQLARRQRVASTVRFLSPAILAHDALTDLAGSGSARHEWFIAQVDRFHDEWRRYFNTRIAKHEVLTDYGGNPRFSFQEEPLSAPVTRTFANLAGVLVLTGVVLAAAWRAVARGQFTVR